ncbi:fungal-specific transcription factor domain-containing protein [Podospora fimiseda]|uniref:Fungal-specific transcription factor domain-containing protein n=1 Tax=Podospora fimiseda TaxID=252190 RepID=A0AAN7H3I4_9PEZI|nr:fungal-specific transcription factor domain-containing protein [Podospora fimiseda]
MTSKPRSFAGCWTCRLRRKKCDESRPICNACTSLDINCTYGSAKPEWMDGGEKQREKGEWLKREIKKRANLRRERRNMQGLEVKLESLGVAGEQDDQSIITTALQDTLESAEISGTTTDSSTSGHSTDSPATQPSPPSGNETYNNVLLVEAVGPALSLEDRDAHSIMFYLDYVFPFQFPFYRPSFLDMGRGWLLVLLTKNKALFHIAMTMSSYFYGLVLSNSTETLDEHKSCTAANLQLLQNQQQRALQCLQQELRDVVNKGVKGHLAEAGRVMASIVQLLTSEVAVANFGNWTMHLEAASELFDEMMKHHGSADDGHHCFMMLLFQLGSIPFSWTPRFHPWGTDQATLRFFTAQLLYFDTIASVTLEQPPRLERWHRHLLSGPEDDAHLPKGDKEHTLPHINLEEFCGLQNWIITTLTEITTLSNWKKQQKQSSSLSISELVRRAQPIESFLSSKIQQLEQQQNQPSTSDCPTATSLHAYSTSQAIHDKSFNTIIWAQAILIYLKVVVSGWQPASPEIVSSVTSTMNLLMHLPSPKCLHTLVWPFTVAGCLASPEQETVFREMFNAMGPIQAFGTVKEGVGILEHVWGNRGRIEQEWKEGWDLSACFRCLGRPSLLI